jgi:hypothetical protein
LAEVKNQPAGREAAGATAQESKCENFELLRRLVFGFLCLELIPGNPDQEVYFAYYKNC